MNSHLAPRDLGRDLAPQWAVPENANCWHDNTAHRDQNPVALDTSDHADHTAARVLQSPEMCAEIFRCSERVEHFAHYCFPPREREHSNIDARNRTLNFQTAAKNFSSNLIEFANGYATLGEQAAASTSTPGHAAAADQSFISLVIQDSVNHTITIATISTTGINHHKLNGNPSKVNTC